MSDDLIARLRDTAVIRAADIHESADRIAALEAQVGALPEAHDEQLAIWADELISDLILSGLMELSGHDYGTKVGAHRAIVAALKSANEAATPTPEPAPADPVAAARVLLANPQRLHSALSKEMLDGYDIGIVNTLRAIGDASHAE